MIRSSISFRSMGNTKSCNWFYSEQDTNGFARNFGGTLPLTDNQSVALYDLAVAGIDTVTSNITAVILNGDIPADGALQGRGVVTTNRKDNPTFKKTVPVFVVIGDPLGAEIRALYATALAAALA